MNVFERFSSEVLPADWSWINEPAEWRFDDSKSLQISAPSRADFFRDPSGAVTKSSAPFLHTTLQGDFTIWTRVRVDMKQPYDSGCLMMMADDTHWAKLCFEYFESTPSILSVVTRDTSDDCISGAMDVSNPYLRVARAGNCFAFHYSSDGQHWKLARYFGMNVPNQLKVGVVAQSPVGEGCAVTFDALTITNHVSEDIRNVE
jgi:regulation of enolase protein 1 (concanavalin A-like superfamily)